MKRGLLLVLFGALLLRALPIGHSLPHKYVPDTHVINGALGMAKSKDLAPPAGTYSSYPYLMPYLLLPAYVAVYAVGRATGTWSGAEEFGGAIIDDPTVVHLVARVLVVLFGLLGVWLTYRIGRRTTGKKIALIAAGFVATSFLLVHLSQSARPWVAISTLVLWTAERSLALSRRPTRRRAVLAGLAAGLTAACHQTGALAVLLPASALLPRLRREPGTVIAFGLIAALSFGASALVAGYPYLAIGEETSLGEGPSSTVDNDVSEKDPEATEASVGIGGQGFAFESLGVGRFPETASGLLLAEPALFLLALFGLLRGWRSLRERNAAAVILVFPVALLGLFLFYEGTHVRYFTPAIPFVALFAGAGVVSLWKQRALRPVAVFLLLAPLVLVARHDFVVSRANTRTQMLEVVVEHVPAGSTIAVEAYGPRLRLSEASLERLLEDEKWWTKQEEREATGAAPASPDRPPFDVVPLERYYRFQSVWPHQWLGGGEKSIEEFLDGVGASWLVTSDRDPGGEPNSALIELLARRGTKVAERLPYDGTPPAHANLPMDPPTPWIDLFAVDRPGPALVLWRLSPP